LFSPAQVAEEFKKSDHLKTLISEYAANFGSVSERDRFAYVQVWP